MVGELLGFDSREDAHDAWSFTAKGSAVFSAKFPPNAAQLDAIPICEEGIPTSDLLRCTANRRNGHVSVSTRRQCIEA